MMDVRVFFRICLFYCLLQSCQAETKLNYLERNGKAKISGCQVENCGPPLALNFIPNPPSIDKQFTILYEMDLVADVFKAFLHWSVGGPYGTHLSGTTPLCVRHRRARDLCPHVKGYHVHGNYTDHLPFFVRAGTPYSANLTLVNDENVVISCCRLACTFDP